MRTRGVGTIQIDYYEMGKINSTHLFGLDEMIIFSYYMANRDRYEKVADLGANIGLHSIVLSKLGFKVSAYEPDNDHLNRLSNNVKINGVEKQICIYPVAVSTANGECEFIRVIGNTTSSHLKGAKENAYGELEGKSKHYGIQIYSQKQ